MVRCSFVILVALASSAGAVAQTAANAGQTAAPSPRPESILPQGTLIYLGTDDLDGLVQRTKTAPMGKILAEQEVKDYCRGKVAHFKVPRYVVFVDEFPTTVTGKVQKYRLRELGVARFGLQVAAGIETA